MQTCGHTIYLHQGDFGGGFPLRLRAHCADCANALLPSDKIVFSATKGGNTLVSKETTWGDAETNEGVFRVAFSAAETATLHPGLYGWTLRLLRGSESCVALADGILEVTL